MYFKHLQTNIKAAIAHVIHGIFPFIVIENHKVLEEIDE